jgi:alpha-L-fucosidase
MLRLPAILFCCIAAVSVQAQKPRPLPPLASPQQLKWAEKEFYLFVHFGPNTFTDKEWGDGKEDPSVFNPSDLDCAQWVRIAKQAGAKGIILTAKHHDGFCLWPSQFSTHTVRESKWMGGKGDVVKALSDACHKAGLEMGVYISPWDRNHPAYGTPAYNDVYISTMKELLTHYGKYFELWWDGANGEGPNGKKQVYDFKRFKDSVFSWQPQLVIFSDVGPGARWCGNERGMINATNWNLLDTVGYKPGKEAPPADTLNRGNINGQAWIPAEADVSIRPGWFYHPAEDSKVKTPETLFNIYLHSVGNGGNMLLNVPPDRAGHFHADDSAALVGFRKLREAAFANDLFKKAVITSESGHSAQLKNLTDDNIQTYWQSGNAQTAGLVFDFRQPVTLNCIVLEEMIAYGQRVKGFTIEQWDGSGYQPVFTGTTIGHKKIAVFPDITTKRIRIKITDSKAMPLLRSADAYRIPLAGVKF